MPVCNSYDSRSFLCCHGSRSKETEAKWENGPTGNYTWGRSMCVCVNMCVYVWAFDVIALFRAEGVPFLPSSPSTHLLWHWRTRLINRTRRGRCSLSAVTSRLTAARNFPVPTFPPPVASELWGKVVGPPSFRPIRSLSTDFSLDSLGLCFSLTVQDGYRTHFCSFALYIHCAEV